MDTEGSTATWRDKVPDVLGILWVFVAALVVLVPALSRGSSLGPYDLLTHFGLSHQAGVIPHTIQRGDQVDEMIPWTTLNWTQVHHGNLPLWNPYSALGLPLAFNWQAASFSLPAIVGYLAPLHLAYTTQLISTLFIAGSGVFVMSRVLGLGPLAATFAATVFELSGSFLGWLGWPHAGVAAWGGWLLAFTLLLLRGRRRVWNFAALALAIAGTIYAGQPEILLLFGATLIAFVAVMLLARTSWLRGSGVIGRPLLDLSLATVGGLALAAPLVLPGLQLLAGSTRNARSPYQALPLHDLAYFTFQGFDGLPLSSTLWFGRSAYGESAAYIGVLALVMCLVAVVRHWRRPEVSALALIAVVGTAVVFLPPAASLADSLPSVGHLLWSSALLPVSLCLALLAGVGLEAVVHSYRDRSVLMWAGGGFIAAAIFLALFWLFGRAGLTSREHAIRSSSFTWPFFSILLGLIVVASLTFVARRSQVPANRIRRLDAGRTAGIVLLVCETAFLVSAGAPLWSSSSHPFVRTPGIAALQQAVGGSVVGFGTHSCFVPPTLGILQEANIAYGVHEFDSYDPITPLKYFSSWYDNTGTSAGTYIPPSAFCPSITTAQAARLYGVRYVLEPRGSNGPAGAVFDKDVGDESLFKIPGAALATLVRLSPGGTYSSTSANGIPQDVVSPTPSMWHVVTHSPHPAVLRLHLSAVPGWRASIDGRPLPLDVYNGVLLQAHIPPGKHVVVLRYWPQTFSLGIALAGLALLGFVTAFVVEAFRRRHDKEVNAPSQERSELVR